MDHQGNSPIDAENESGPRASLTPRISITAVVNGEQRSAQVAPMRRLIDVLRGPWGLMGTKEGCGEGECGACTVLLDGRPVNSCLVPAVHADGAEIRTIEGLSHNGGLHAVQKAFLQHGGAQCGICTPGMAMTAAWLVDKHAGQAVPESEIRQHLAGNLCRCTGYGQIVQAVVDALSQAPEASVAGAAEAK